MTARETGYYYLQSRYYDPAIGRFINADDTSFLGNASVIMEYNIFGYCTNNSINYVDVNGYSPLQWIFAAIGAVAGWYVGDYVARQLGYSSGWKYWAIRTGVVVGGAVIGWFAATLMARIIANYLRNNPAIVFKLVNMWSASVFMSAMNFLGINPFTLPMDSSKFIAIAHLFNSKTITIGFEWAKQLYYKAKALGFTIELDAPHGEYSWHIHIIGGNGRLKNLHIQIIKAAWDFLWNLLH